MRLFKIVLFQLSGPPFKSSVLGLWDYVSEAQEALKNWGGDTLNLENMGGEILKLSSKIEIFGGKMDKIQKKTGGRSPTLPLRLLRPCV